jgi:hypothetical protein
MAHTIFYFLCFFLFIRYTGERFLVPVLVDSAPVRITHRTQVVMLVV